MEAVAKLGRPGQVAIAVTGNNLLARTRVALRTYQESAAQFDKVWYICAAKMIATAPS